MIRPLSKSEETSGSIRKDPSNPTKSKRSLKRRSSRRLPWQLGHGNSLLLTTRMSWINFLRPNPRVPPSSRMPLWVSWSAPIRKEAPPGSKTPPLHARIFNLLQSRWALAVAGSRSGIECMSDKNSLSMRTSVGSRVHVCQGFFSTACGGLKDLGYGRIQGRGPRRGESEAPAGWNWEPCWEASASVRQNVVRDELSKLPRSQ